MAGTTAANEREVLGVRVNKPVQRTIDELADEHDLDRSEVTRRLLRYALENGDAEIFQSNSARQSRLPDRWRAEPEQE